MERLFDKLYSAKEEILKAIKKPYLENSLKRKFGSAHDDANKKIDEAELAIQEIRENINEYNINKILEHKVTIKNCKQLLVEIEEEYKELFGEEMKQ